MTKNQNKNNTTNIADTHSCVTPRGEYSAQDTSTTTGLKPLNATLHIVSVELNTTTKLPPASKLYLCFKIRGRYSHAALCVKSWIINKAIDSILSIDAFEQKCVVIKGIVKLPRLEYHMNNIGIDQLLCNKSSFEEIFLNNINRYINMQVSVTTNKTSTIF